MIFFKDVSRIASILKKEITFEGKDFDTNDNCLYLKGKEKPKIHLVDIVSVKSKMDKLLEKIRRKKILEDIKQKIEENLNPDAISSDDESTKEQKEKDSQKAYSEIHKMLLLRNAKNEPYFLELEELFCLKSILFEAIFHDDDNPCLYFRNLFNAIKGYFL